MIYAHIGHRIYGDQAKLSGPPKGGNYYDEGGITVLDVMKAKLTPEQYRGYLLGNIVKYSLRLNFKGVSKQDAHKLADYSRWLDELENDDPRGN